MKEFILMGDVIIKKEHIASVYITPVHNYEDVTETIYVPNFGIFKRGTFKSVEITVARELSTTYAIKIQETNYSVSTVAEFNTEQEAKIELNRILKELNEEE